MTLVSTAAKASGSGGGAITQISDSTLGASAASFDITGIVQTYNHLLLVVLARTDRASTLDTLRVRFNNDSGANYYAEQNLAAGTGGTASATEFLAQTGGNVGTVTAATALASRFGIVQVLIPAYAQTTAFKTFGATSASPITTTTGNERIDQYGGSWDSAVAISRITVFPQTGPNFIAGSRCTLYGLT